MQAIACDYYIIGQMCTAPTTCCGSSTGVCVLKIETEEAQLHREILKSLGLIGFLVVG